MLCEAFRFEIPPVEGAVCFATRCVRCLFSLCRVLLGFLQLKTEPSRNSPTQERRLCSHVVGRR